MVCGLMTDGLDPMTVETDSDLARNPFRRRTPHYGTVENGKSSNCTVPDTVA